MANLIKYFKFVQKRDSRQMICKFRVLLRAADANMNHRAGSLTD